MRENGGQHDGTATGAVTSSIAPAAAAVRSASELAQLLRDLRRRDARRCGEPALTYRELAARTGWSHAIIGEYFTGAALPPTDRFDELIRLLGATRPEWGPLATARDRVEELRRSGQPAATAAPVPAAPPGVPMPRELPAPVSGFVGRSRQLSELDRLTGTDAGSLVVAAICGGGGTGKTALAVQWAHQRAERFPDGQLYIDLRGHAAGSPVDPGEALERFLLALGVEAALIPGDLDQRASRYRTAIAGRRLLVVLDNAVSAEQVRPLLPGSATCMVVVTSRDSLAGLVVADGAHRIELGVLTDGEAVALLRGLLGNRIDVAPEHLRTLARLCGRLPLSLRIAAELAADRAAPLAGLVDDLSDERARLELLDAGDARTAVRSVFSWSYRRLSPSAARLFRLLGEDPGPDLSLRAAASLAGEPVATSRRTLAELRRAHMVHEAVPGRYALPEVLRAYAAGLAHDLDPEAERQAAARRLLDHYAHSALAAVRVVDPHGALGSLGSMGSLVSLGSLVSGDRLADDGVCVVPFDGPNAAHTWFAAERSSLVAAVRFALEHGFPEHARLLSRAMLEVDHGPTVPSTMDERRSARRDWRRAPLVRSVS